MPCNTRVRTSVPDLVKMVQPRLAAVLEQDGWTVTHSTVALSATKGAMVLTVDQSTKTASLSTYYGSTAAESTLAGIRRAYATRTVAEVSKRFGFRQVGQAAPLENGAQRLLFQR